MLVFVKRVGNFKNQLYQTQDFQEEELYGLTKLHLQIWLMQIQFTRGERCSRIILQR